MSILRWTQHSYNQRKKTSHFKTTKPPGGKNKRKPLTKSTIKSKKKHEKRKQHQRKSANEQKITQPFIHTYCLQPQTIDDTPPPIEERRFAQPGLRRSLRIRCRLKKVSPHKPSSKRAPPPKIITPKPRSPTIPSAKFSSYQAKLKAFFKNNPQYDATYDTPLPGFKSHKENMSPITVRESSSTHLNT